MIVVIHTVNYGIMSPILRCAVPLFFMISATFFWAKIQMQKGYAKRSYLGKIRYQESYVSPKNCRLV